MTKGFIKQRKIAGDKIIKVNQDFIKEIVERHRGDKKPFDIPADKKAYCTQLILDDGKSILCNGYIWVKLNEPIADITNCPDNLKSDWKIKEVELKEIIKGNSNFGESCIYQPMTFTLKQIKTIKNSEFTKVLKDKCLFSGKLVYQFGYNKPLVNLELLVTLMKLLCDNDKTEAEFMIPKSTVQPIVIKTNNGYGVVLPLRQQKPNKYFEWQEQYNLEQLEKL